MGFEGYYQIVCNFGHLHSIDVYEFDFLGVDWKCPNCGSDMQWYNLVSQTNPCDYDNCELPPKEKNICCDHGCGYIKLKEKTPAEYQVCNLGFNHCVKPATYEIPKDKGHLVKKKT